MTAIRNYFNEIGRVSGFAGLYFKKAFVPPYEAKEFLRQCYIIGYRTFPLVAITGFIMGLVLTLQSKPTLEKFGAEALLPGMVAISIVREIGPVITSLICAGKIGSGIGAELGSMKVTEQIDAMEVSAAGAFNYLVVTRVMATTLMIPALVILSDFISLCGSYTAVNFDNEVSFGFYFNELLNALDFSDVVPAFIKSFFFGFTIGIIGTYMGYHSNKGTEGVGKAANTAVVTASVIIFIIDMIAVQLTEFFISD